MVYRLGVAGMKVPGREIDQNRAGIIYGIVAYTLWGILPLYWKLLIAVPPLEILAHRIFWSFFFMVLLIAFTGRWKAVLAVFSSGRKFLLMFLCGFVISVNWFTYIYAVNTDHVIEASMGYFINPLVVVLLGVTVFREKLSRWQLAALILAATGVIIMTAEYGRVPWIALFLAGTFAFYGLAKKLARVDALTGLTLETMAVMPIAIIYIAYLETGQVGALGTLPLSSKVILAGAGIVTATPLLLFARGIEKTTFSMMGFLQYIAPSMTLFLGIFIFREPFSLIDLISFCFIWAALTIFTLANTGVLKESLNRVPGEENEALKLRANRQR
jgi:chloramphenicol-sensitive protein RarD